MFAHRFDGWGTHDCERTEAAGVQCKPKPPPTTPPPTTTTPRPKIEIHKSHGHSMKVRLAGGRDAFEGRVEVQLEETGLWGPICGDGWGVREAMVRGFVTDYIPMALNFSQFFFKLEFQENSTK